MEFDEPILDEGPLKSLDTLPGGRVAVQELLVIFEEDVPQRLEALRARIAEGRPQEASVEAHSLKGGAGNMGLVRLAAIAKALETRLKDEENLDCEDLLTALSEEFPKALGALQEAFPPTS